MAEGDGSPEMGQMIDFNKFKETGSLTASDVTGQEPDPNRISLADIQNRITQSNNQPPSENSRWFPQPAEANQGRGLWKRIKSAIKKP